MVYAVARKATLLIPSGPSLHLFIVLTDPCKNDQCAVVSLSSIKAGQFHDPTCLVDTAEHPFVTRSSFVAYRLGQVMHCAAISKAVASWSYTPRETCADGLFERVCTGVELSDFSPGFFVRYFLNNC